MGGTEFLREHVLSSELLKTAVQSCSSVLARNKPTSSVTALGGPAHLVYLSM